MLPQTGGPYSAATADEQAIHLALEIPLSHEYSPPPLSGDGDTGSEDSGVRSPPLMKGFYTAPRVQDIKQQAQHLENFTAHLELESSLSLGTAPGRGLPGHLQDAPAIWATISTFTNVTTATKTLATRRISMMRLLGFVQQIMFAVVNVGITAYLWASNVHGVSLRSHEGLQSAMLWLQFVFVICGIILFTGGLIWAAHMACWGGCEGVWGHNPFTQSPAMHDWRSPQAMFVFGISFMRWSPLLLLKYLWYPRLLLSLLDTMGRTYGVSFLRNLSMKRLLCGGEVGGYRTLPARRVLGMLLLPLLVLVLWLAYVCFAVLALVLRLAVLSRVSTNWSVGLDKWQPLACLLFVQFVLNLASSTDMKQVTYLDAQEHLYKYTDEKQLQDSATLTAILDAASSDTLRERGACVMLVLAVTLDSDDLWSAFPHGLGAPVRG